MKIDRCTKVVLTVIAVALVVIATRPLLTPSPSYAARSIEFKIERVGGSLEQAEARLNALGKEGWDVAAPLGTGGTFVMKR